MKTLVFCDLVASTALYERMGNLAGSQFVTQLVSALGNNFVQHGGKVVKTLGDGLFVLFAEHAQALKACVAIQKQLAEQPIVAGGSGAPVALQMGVACGDVVEIDGDCFGDAVNIAARLSNLAGAGQILTSTLELGTDSTALVDMLRPLGPIYLRGKSDSTDVFRLQWQQEADSEATMMRPSSFGSLEQLVLEVSLGGAEIHRVRTPNEKLVVGRGTAAALVLTDPRVSRTHATFEARGNQFVVVDTSSYGTWVYNGGQAAPVLLRRTECVLVGSGEIALGCERAEHDAPVISFALR